MEELLLDIITHLKEDPESVDLDKFVHAHNRGRTADERPYSKKRLSAFYYKTRQNDPDRWTSWGIDPETEKRLITLLQVKPRRSASGVATITVMAKPWPCGNHCLYCPNDIRMPKSYLSDEPVCQRAERNWFDPYLQVVGRLRALNQMGHVTDKVEIIILGGTWCDYPQDYQRWFVREVFRALNDSEDDTAEVVAKRIRSAYKQTGILSDRDEIIARVEPIQEAIKAHDLDYDAAFKQVYAKDESWCALAHRQKASWADIEAEHTRNVNAKHRVVGLVMETRPETLNFQTLYDLRRLGATKIQIGVQSLEEAVLAINTRKTSLDDIRRAFVLLRLFGFKIHAHFMVNLLGATPDGDKADFLRFVREPDYLPDEIKLYPCALVAGTELCLAYNSGDWVPYTEETLLEVLETDVANTPPYVRISRMIRDISAHDIVAGNKKANLRQLVEEDMVRDERPIQEIRAREISTSEVSLEDLKLDEVAYHTSVSEEYFLQWITPGNRIAGFLRLSLPHQDMLDDWETSAHQENVVLPIKRGQAMIREVHIYGSAVSIHTLGRGVQHLGLGCRAIERACAIAHEAGYSAINVISAVGTRGYYEKLGFKQRGLYHTKPLTKPLTKLLTEDVRGEARNIHG